MAEDGARRGRNMDWLPLFEGQMLVCGVLAKALYGAPDAAWLASLVEARTFDAAPFAGGLAEMEAGLGLLRGWSARSAGPHGVVEVDQLVSDYTCLFIGPGKLLAAPWESVYANKDRAVFQMESVGVKNWYARFGLALATDYNEPADHVGLQFAFLAHLSGLIVAAAQIRDGREVERLIAAQRGFLGQHMARWVPRWASDVGQHAKTDFYRGVALLARSVVAESASFLLIPETKQPGTGAYRMARN